MGALVGPGWVTTAHGTATRGRDTAFTERVLVDYPAGTMFPPQWGGITLTILAPAITYDTVRFIGEQDGIPEREFKERVVALLDGCGIVERGYLARVAYESASAEVVALCLLAQQPQDALLRRSRRCLL